MFASKKGICARNECLYPGYVLVDITSSFSHRNFKKRME